MRFAFTDDHKLFADGLTDLLNDQCPPLAVRQVWDDHTGHAPELWNRLADLGLFSLLVDTDAGGMGGGMVDAVLLFERLGAAAVPGPVIEQMVVVAPALAGTDRSHAAMDGSLVGTATADAAAPVPHARCAQVVVTADGVLGSYTATAVDSLDGGRLLATLSGGSLTDAGPSALDAEAMADRMALAVAAQLVGISAAMIDLAAEYARQRHQFGKPIGTFQAVKHLMADALAAAEFAKAPLWQAAWSLDNDLPTAPADVSAARVLANTAAHRAARSALQVHGAIGYTWECDLHLWMKKVWALQAAWGDTNWHRRRVSRYLLGTGGGVPGPALADDTTTMPGLAQAR
jgi:alkylation response protein AidB-like acyl-CoA dehydrogenase